MASKEKAKTPEAAAHKTLWNSQYCILVIINLMISLTVYMTNTFMSQHLAALDINAALSGTILGVMSIASMLIRPVSGWLCDRFNRKLLLVLCNGVIAAVLLGYGLAGTALAFYVLRGFHGIAFGLTTTITMAFIMDYIPKDRVGEGMGYFGLGQSVAAAVGPWMGLALAARYGGAAAFFAASAAVLTGAGFACALRINPGHADLQKSKIGKSSLQLNRFIAAEALPYAVVTIALSAANGIETSYIASYADTMGIESIGWYFTLSAATLFGARLLLGKLTDKKGFVWVLLPGALLIAAALVLLSLIRPENALLLFAAAAVIKACGVGALQPGIQAMCVQSVPAQRRGAASSTYYIGTDLGQGMSTMAAGRMISEMGYAPMFRLFTLPLLLVVGIFMATAALIKKE